MLTVIERAENYISPKGGKCAQFSCKCDCGNMVVVTANRLKGGRTKSCGCLNKKLTGERAHKLFFKDLTGERFGRLTAIKESGRNKKGRVIWLCLCDCGNYAEASSDHLQQGYTTSCGCLSDERRRMMAPIALKKNIETNARGLVDGTAAVLLNQTIRRDNKTGVRGVYAGNGKFYASIGFKRKVYRLGTHSTIEEAAAARKEAEQRIWGDFLEWYNNEYRQRLNSN